jgi:hypothetical protein
MNKLITTATMGILTAGSLMLGVSPKAAAYQASQSEHTQRSQQTLTASVYCVTDNTGQYCEDSEGNWYFIAPDGSWILVTG